jgi:hypothetical protein
MVREIPLTKREVKKIPEILIREVLRGEPLYYEGYRDVMSGLKKPEEIMGCSSLQSILLSILDFYIQSRINRKKYWLGGNEAGLHLGHKNNLSTDLGIFLKEKVTLTTNYFEVAPEVSIEVDVKIDVNTLGEKLEYIFEKSEEMMLFGTQKVIWILTKPKKIFIIEKDETTKVFDWNNEIKIIDGIVLNLKSLLEEEGVDF